MAEEGSEEGALEYSYALNIGILGEEEEEEHDGDDEYDTTFEENKLPQISLGKRREPEQPRDINKEDIIAGSTNGAEQSISLINPTHQPKEEKHKAAANTQDRQTERAPNQNRDTRNEEASTSTSTNRNPNNPPWLRNRGIERYEKIRSPTLRLHKEIQDVCKLVQPREEETKRRKEALRRVEQIAQSIWPTCRLEVFGSFASGLYLPSSDIDASIANSNCNETVEGLRALAKALAENNAGSHISLITRAKVPLVRLEESVSLVKFDISFSSADASAPARFVKSKVGDHPALHPLATVVKLFLQQRELNEVYSGGLGSYSVFVLLVSLIKEEPESNLGYLLVRFFELYGSQLDISCVSVSCGQRSYYELPSKSEPVQSPPNAPDRLHMSILDPLDAENDLGTGSFNMRLIRMAFVHAAQMLTGPTELGVSLLGRILSTDPASYSQEAV